jgi:hypothetical protein
LFEELRVSQVDFDDKTLACDIHVKPFDGSERRGVQQAFWRLTSLLDILFQHTCRIISSLNDQRVAFPMTNGMTERTPRAVFGMGLTSAIRQFNDFEKTKVRTVPRRRSGNAHFGARFEELRGDPDAAELRDAMGFADVFLSTAILVKGVDMEVAVRVSRFVRFHRTRDVHLLAGVKMRREAVMRSPIRCGKHDENAGTGDATRNFRKHDTSAHHLGQDIVCVNTHEKVMAFAERLRAFRPAGRLPHPCGMEGANRMVFCCESQMERSKS